MLRDHSWPGNVRELDNVIQRALILSNSDQIEAKDIILEDVAIHSFANLESNSFESILVTDVTNSEQDDNDEVSAVSEKIYNENGLKVQEQQTILDALNVCKGKRKDVAALLKISPRTLRYKIAKMKDQGLVLPL